MTRIAIIVDHPQRDLAGLVLTAFKLCQEGITCHLVPLNLQATELWALAPDFVLLNFARRGTEKLAAHLSEAGIQFGVLDTEGGVWGSPEKYSELLWLERSLLREAKCMCAWGPAMADHVVEAGFLDQNQVTVTGCPRFDLYHPLWRSVLDGDTELTSGDTELTSKARPKRILVNTNYSFSNPRFASIESHVERVQREFGWPLEDAMKMLNHSRTGTAAVLELARNLSRDFPRSEVVLRPHPFEQDEFYRSSLGDLKNVSVDGLGPVQPQICGSDVVIQRSCTTAVEAGMASVPTLSPQWVPPEMEVPSAEEVSIPCASYPILRNTVEEILNGGYQQPDAVKRAIVRVIDTWFYRVDGRAHQRVSDTILSCLDDVSRVDKHGCVSRLYGVSRGSGCLGGRVRKNLGLSPDWSFRRMRNVPSLHWTKTNKFFGVEEVQNLTRRVESATRASGLATHPVEVGFARLRADYLRNYNGHSITLTRNI